MSALLPTLFVVGGGALASGCSWLYDPDDLPDFEPPEPPPEPPACRELAIDPLPASFALLEGVGDTGDATIPDNPVVTDPAIRPALLVITGKNFLESATLELTGADGQRVPGVELAGPPVISRGYADSLAVPVIARVDELLLAGAEIPLKITVAQGCEPDLVNPEPAIASRSIEWRLRGFGEILSTESYTFEAQRVPPTFSVVSIAGTLGVSGSTRQHPLILRSNSSIRVTGMVQVNAVGRNAGAGGGDGGAGTSDGSGPGFGQGFPAALLTAGNGGGGGFATAATGTLAGAAAGDPFVTYYENFNRGSGGGGGASLLGSAGGAGGGGGGTVELSALGATILGEGVSARGGAGAGNNGSAGGGGSGGVIVVRGGTKVSAASPFNVSGGASAATANSGALGRIRIDSPEVAVPDETKNLAIRGVTFPAGLPIITDQEELELPLIGSPRASVEVVVSDLNNAVTDLATVSFENASEASVKLKLQRGYNRICVAPTLQTSSSKEGATNCIELAYIRNYEPMTTSRRPR